LVPVTLLALLPLAAACSSSAPEPLTTSRTISLRSDVLPIFMANCSTTATCHGSPTGIEVFLAGGAANAASIRKGIVGVKAAELSSMPYVTAGDPTKSYLMLKLEGQEHQYDGQCTDSSCGAQMPLEGAPLDATTQATIRSWIEQGALDN
jgi:hypothetical protein